MSFVPIDDPVFKSIGDKAHYAALASSLLYACAVTLYANDDADTFFDEDWKKEGFCVANPDVPFWSSYVPCLACLLACMVVCVVLCLACPELNILNMLVSLSLLFFWCELRRHDACLYLDTAAALLLGLLYLVIRETPGMESANELFFPGLIGIFAHGVGHGAIGSAIRDGRLFDDKQMMAFEALQNMPPLEIVQLQAPIAVFWIGLVKASTPNLSNLAIGGIVIAAQLVQLFVPQYLGFTYVQTVLMLAYSLNQLARKSQEKNFIYATYPLIVGLPVTLVGWMESTQCTSFVKEKFYGHLVYDGFIPFALLTWYIVCYLRVGLDNDSPQPIKDKHI